LAVAIRAYDESDLEAVVGLYNELVAEIPYNWPVTQAEFADEVMGQGVLARADLPFDPADLLIGSVAGRPVGFLHYTARAVQESAEEGKRVGLIRFATFPEDRPEIGEALLGVAIERLQQAGCTAVEAWQMSRGYPFYTSQHGGCWEASRMANLFLSHGFENYHREVVLHRALSFGLDPPLALTGKILERATQPLGHDSLHLYAVMDGPTEAARSSWHRMSALSRHPSAGDSGYIYNVRTSESHRRQHLGSYLMGQMIADMHEAGLKEIALHTMFDNIPAIGLYTKSGFRYIGTNVIYRRSVDQGGG